MRLPSLRKHKTGQGFFTLHGHDYYCGVWGKAETQVKYERLLSEYLANKHTFVAAKTGASTTIEDLAVSYLEYAKETYNGREFSNIKLIANAILDLYSELPAGDFGGSQFKTVRAKFAAEKIKRERSRQYVNKCMRLLIRMMRWCTGEGLVDPKVIGVLREIEPLKRGRTTAPESKKVDEIPEAIVNATLPHMPQVIADMVRLQQLLGCRPGELCSLTPSMVNRTDKAVWAIDLEKHKNAHRGHSREIYIGPKAQAILRPYLDRDPDRHCFTPTEAMAQRKAAKAAARTTSTKHGNRAGYNSTTRARGAPAAIELNDSYNTGSYGHAIKYACKQAWPAPDGYTKEQAKAWHAAHSWSPNQLRHSAAAEIREAFGLEHCAAVLGHADIDTSKIYASLRRTKAKEAAATR